MKGAPQQTEVDNTTSCKLNSTSKLDFNSTYQLGEIWVNKLDFLNPSVYHPHIIQISPRYQLGENSSFNPDMARLLPVKTPLWNSIKTPLLEDKSRILLNFNSSFCLLGHWTVFRVFYISSKTRQKTILCDEIVYLKDMPSILKIPFGEFANLTLFILFNLSKFGQFRVTYIHT